MNQEFFNENLSILILNEEKFIEKVLLIIDYRCYFNNNKFYHNKSIDKSK